MYEWIMLGIGLVLTVGTGLFVASEFALVNLDRNDLEARAGPRRETPRPHHQSPEDHLDAPFECPAGHHPDHPADRLHVRAGHQFAARAGRCSAQGSPKQLCPASARWLASSLPPSSRWWSASWCPRTSPWHCPLATAKVVIPFQALFTAVFKPVILLFNNTANAIIRSFGIEPKEELSGARSAEELSSLVRRSALEGLLDLDHATLLHRTLRFSEHSAADVMTPRVRMTAVGFDDTAEDIVALATSTGYSRFPVIGRDRDDVLGVLHVKQAFAVALEDRGAGHRVRPDDRAPQGARIHGR